jgi:uncharacterized protein YbcI
MNGSNVMDDVRYYTEMEARPAAGQLSATIARRVFRVFTRVTGRGPTKARAFFNGNVVVVVLEDALTAIERNLADNGRVEAVKQMRHEVHESMRPSLVGVVEQSTGCSVVALMSDYDVAPDVATAIFLLDRNVPC